VGVEELNFGVHWCDWDEVIRNVLGDEFQNGNTFQVWVD